MSKGLLQYTILENTLCNEQSSFQNEQLIKSCSLEYGHVPLVKRSFHFRQTIVENVITASELILCCISKDVRRHYINEESDQHRTGSRRRIDTVHDRFLDLTW